MQNLWQDSVETASTKHQHIVFQHIQSMRMIAAHIQRNASLSRYISVISLSIKTTPLLPLLASSAMDSPLAIATAHHHPLNLRSRHDYF